MTPSTIGDASAPSSIADVIPDGQGGAECPLRDLGAINATSYEDGA